MTDTIKAVIAGGARAFSMVGFGPSGEGLNDCQRAPCPQHREAIQRVDCSEMGQRHIHTRKALRSSLASDG
jgi:hypothetical protein